MMSNSLYFHRCVKESDCVCLTQLACNDIYIRVQVWQDFKAIEIYHTCIQGPFVSQVNEVDIRLLLGQINIEL